MWVWVSPTQDIVETKHQSLQALRKREGGKETPFLLPYKSPAIPRLSWKEGTAWTQPYTSTSKVATFFNYLFIQMSWIPRESFMHIHKKLCAWSHLFLVFFSNLNPWVYNVKIKNIEKLLWATAHNHPHDQDTPLSLCHSWGAAESFPRWEYV